MTRTPLSSMVAIRNREDGWRYDLENAPRTGPDWIYIAAQTAAHPNGRVYQARWVSDRWLTPEGNVSPKAVYAWAHRLEPPAFAEDGGDDDTGLV